MAILLPARGLKAGFRRFSVAEYHKLIDVGVLTENDDLELLEGLLVNKTPRNPRHDGTIQLVQRRLLSILPISVCLRVQSAITLSDSEPEPDVVIALGNERTFLDHHPQPAEIVLVIEVANTTLDDDREDKARIYARAGLPCYWIVNLINHQIEVYTHPTGPTDSPYYQSRQDFSSATMIPLVVDQQSVMLAARDLLS